MKCLVDDVGFIKWRWKESMAKVINVENSPKWSVAVQCAVCSWEDEKHEQSQQQNTVAQMV